MYTILYYSSFTKRKYNGIVRWFKNEKKNELIFQHKTWCDIVE
jgi:hypothetical protein